MLVDTHARLVDGEARETFGVGGGCACHRGDDPIDCLLVGAGEGALRLRGTNDEVARFLNAAKIRVHAGASGSASETRRAAPLGSRARRRGP